MTAFTLGSIWEEMVAFLRRESGLLIPVAMATFAVAAILMDMGVGDAAADPQAAAANAGAAMLLAIPAGFLMLLGNLAVCMITLVPGISVAEALRRAFRRMPRAIAAVLLLLIAAAAVILVVVILVTLVTLPLGTGAANASKLAAALMMAPMLYASIRLLLLTPTIAMEDLTPVAAIRRAWALGQRQFTRLLGAFVVLTLVTIVIALIEQLVVGSIVLLLTRLMGGGELPGLLSGVFSAAVSGVISMAAAVFVALIYRRLTAA